MKKTITLNFTLVQIQQLLQDGNYVSSEETLDEVSFSKETGVTFTFSDKRFEIGNKDDEDKMKKLLETKIEDLDLGTGSHGALIVNNIETLGQIVQHSYNDLLKLKKLGQKRAKEIETVVHNKGLKLKKS